MQSWKTDFPRYRSRRPAAVGRRCSCSDHQLFFTGTLVAAGLAAAVAAPAWANADTAADPRSAAGSTFHPDCRVWQQFLYATDYDCDIWGCDAGVYIEYWLINYGECPTNANWTQSGNNCWINSNIASAPDFPITDLAKLSLHAAAQPGGQDCVVVYDDTGAGWGVCANDSVLDISSVWDKTEFNIVGDTGGSRAQFGSGTSFIELLRALRWTVVQTSLRITPWRTVGP
jgi:hypothetical protein